MIEPSLLRLLWAVIEDVPSQDLLSLSDTALLAMLLREVSRRVLLRGEEVCGLYEYISSRLLLIRDIADYRCYGSLHPVVRHQFDASMIDVAS